MKIVIVSLCLVVAVLSQDKYESINDDFDLSEVLNNERLLNSYAKCLLNKGPCTPEVKQVKENSTMKAVWIAMVAIAIPLVICYDEKFDKIDVDKIIGDDNLFSAYINCMLDKGPCDVELSSDFKKLLPEVIATCCEKCSPIQKQNIKKTVKALSSKKPDEFNQFRAKYDPKGEFEKDFTAFVFSD